jgi:hypothetical protein
MLPKCILQMAKENIKFLKLLITLKKERKKERKSSHGLVVKAEDS